MSKNVIEFVRSQSMHSISKSYYYCYYSSLSYPPYHTYDLIGQIKMY